MADWSTNPTDEFNDVETAFQTVLDADAFLGNGTYSLSSDTTVDQTTVWLDTTGLPSKGVLLVGTERVKYTGKTAATITGCTRGEGDSAAASHSAGATLTTYNIAQIHPDLRTDIRDYGPENLPALAFETVGTPDDERATFGQWDHHIDLELWVVCRDVDYDVAATECKLLTSEVRRCFRIQELSDYNLDGLLRVGQIFLGPTTFSYRRAEFWDGSAWWKRSTTRVRAYHEAAE